MHEIIIELPDESATQVLAEKLALAVAVNFKPYRFYLSGDLGAGKTAFARFFLRSMGVASLIKSPTYTLVEPYETLEHCFLHADLYRLISPDEIYELGLIEQDHALWIIEWAQKAGTILPNADVNFEFLLDLAHPDKHQVKISLLESHVLYSVFQE